MSQQLSSDRENGHVKANDAIDPSMSELHSNLAHHIATLNEYLQSKGLPQPSTQATGPRTVLAADAPPHIQEARQEILAASLKLHALAAGPSDFLPNLAVDFGYLPCLSWLCHYRVFQHVPLEDGISYTDLASALGLPEQRLKSIARMVMTSSLFHEDRGGTHIRHSATSAFLAADEDAFAYACWLCERTGPMAMAMTEAHKRWGPGSTALTETAYNVAFDTDLPFFQHLQKDKSATEGFAKYMRAVRSSDSVSMRYLVGGFDWQDIRQGGLVVDVGGSSGDAAVALASAFPHLTFVVEDLAENVHTGSVSVARSQPADIASRVAFHEHDFMQPQPVRGADVYLLRMILHDWPDSKAVEILSRLAEAMEPGRSRLLIMDTVLPRPGSVPVSAERIVRCRDLTMMQAFNARERELEDWETLIAATYPTLRLLDVRHPVGSAMSMLEVGLCA